MDESTPTTQHDTFERRLVSRAVVFGVILSGLLTCAAVYVHDGLRDSAGAGGTGTASTGRNIVFFNQSDPPDDQQRYISVWWGDAPAEVLSSTIPSSSGHSNIHPEDYAGVDSCRKCHTKNFHDWSKHPHRWMNALADETSVKGDFSGIKIQYLGGSVTFFQSGGENRMRLERETSRTFSVRQTLGSRFFQYYIGRQIAGPTDDPILAERDHVLPIGYWLEEKEWVPVVHIWGSERPDGERLDPFDTTSYAAEFTDYATACSHCHTTFAISDIMAATKVENLANEVPRNLHWSASEYLADTLPASPESFTTDEIVDLLSRRDTLPAPEHAVALGITCEACHLGCAEHVINPDTKPSFFPLSPHLRVESKEQSPATGPTHANVNWACGRCHTGPRPQLSAGMSTWNSTEYSDAMRGSCYSELKCIDCHNPHEAIGKLWSRSPKQDDASCTKCHAEFSDKETVAAHTHHPVDSSGSRCMNCHMPRLNEGLQDVVRTHMIFSPTNAQMIESNQPNACNQCHVKESISWTQKHLAAWYAKSFDPAAVDRNYADKNESAVLGWMKSDNESVRLIAADSLFRQQAAWAVDELVGALNDPFLLNRQFARRGLEKMLNTKLNDFGYRFYMTPEERKQPVLKIMEAAVKLLADDAPDVSDN